MQATQNSLLGLSAIMLTGKRIGKKRRGHHFFLCASNTLPDQKRRLVMVSLHPFRVRLFQTKKLGVSGSSRAQPTVLLVLILLAGCTGNPDASYPLRESQQIAVEYREAATLMSQIDSDADFVDSWPKLRAQLAKIDQDIQVLLRYETNCGGELQEQELKPFLAAQRKFLNAFVKLKTKVSQDKILQVQQSIRTGLTL